MNILKNQTRLFLVGTISMGLCLLPNVVRAQTFKVDQSNTHFLPSLFQNIKYYESIGQEFTPNMSALNEVDLVTTNFGDSDNSSSLLVNIHQGSMTGSIVGTSSTVTLFGGNSPVVTKFNFSSPVRLTPNTIFTMEVVQVSGDNWGVGSSGGLSSSYSGGNQILQGIPILNNDLWFREGMTNNVKSNIALSAVVPEPSSILGLLTFGTLGVGSAFKRQLRKQK